MGTINEKVDPRSAETKCKFHDDSGWNRTAGSESGSNGDKQERIDRAHSSEPDFIGNGDSVTGKILRQLIDESQSQVANKKAEILQLESKIREFNTLLEQLEANKKA